MGATTQMGVVELFGILADCIAGLDDMTDPAEFTEVPQISPLQRAAVAVEFANTLQGLDARFDRELFIGRASGYREQGGRLLGGLTVSTANALGQPPRLDSLLADEATYPDEVLAFIFGWRCRENGDAVGRKHMQPDLGFMDAGYAMAREFAHLGLMPRTRTMSDPEITRLFHPILGPMFRAEHVDRTRAIEMMAQNRPTVFAQALPVWERELAPTPEPPTRPNGPKGYSNRADAI